MATDHSPDTSSTRASAASGDTLARRDFLKVAGTGAGMLLLGGCAPDVSRVPGLHHERRIPLVGPSSHVAVVGAGAFGGWTALHLRQMGAKVTLIDAYGPGNSRSTSGDETRGVRSSYGDRDTGEMWMLWAREAMNRWRRFDDEWGRELEAPLLFHTGDLILRAEAEPFTTRTQAWWKKHRIPFEVMQPAEVRYRWPVIDTTDIGLVLSEPDAGVVRARRATQAVASVFEKLGGTIVIGRAVPPKLVGGKLEEIVLDTGQKIRADVFVFACGPWLGKTFPELLANRLRAPLGYVCYYGTPVSDERFTHPHMPSYNFPGVTGWPTLPVDSRGFRVRGSLKAKQPKDAKDGKDGKDKKDGKGPGKPAPPPTPPAQLDPDTSDRWPDAARLEGPRHFLAARFPLLANAPLLSTHACHYEISSSQNFIVDRHPAMPNVWIAGAGNAEGFKFGPVVGEYIAQRVLGTEGDPAVAKGFRIPVKEFEVVPPPTDSTGRATPVDATHPGNVAKTK